MVWKLLAPLLGILALASATPALAQEHRICFDPDTTQISPEGYVAAREVSAELAPSEALRGHVILRGPPSPEPFGRDFRRIREVLLELMRVGVGVTRVDVVDDPVQEADCLRLEVVVDGPMRQVLWHFHGLYFDAGSDVVSEAWASALRFIVVGYKPGQIRYCIAGHSDTLGSTEDNMRLSLRRADSTGRELMRQGVRFEDIAIRGFGETRLAHPTADGVGEPSNRRVTVGVYQRCDSVLR